MAKKIIITLQQLILASLFICISLSASVASGQQLKPGFDKAEYQEMLKIALRQATDVDKWPDLKIAPPQHFSMAYRSPVIGLDNIWDLWLNNNGTAVISVRGTTSNATSWLANFYSAMVPAKGTLDLESNFKFNYDLSDDPKAAVHIGWLVSTAYISRDILPRLDSCYKAGIRNFIITGHSQGGVICFLLTSYLESLKKSNRIPADIRFKTYSSAGPKPGNLFYAYTYEHLTRDGWAYNVVNSADWVPETPFSIQTMDDFNSTNAFKNALPLIKKQKFPTNWALRYAYNRLNKPTMKARKNYQKFLGKMLAKSVKKQLPQFQPPAYFPSNNYTRTGATIILFADKDYSIKFPDNPDNIWRHHLIEPYLYLSEKL